uniref:Radial spoke protein 7 n=1 Tax=Tetraselmis sp. GSL018 TaxID=582737 RepID=A0A061SBG2_9CHLO
MSSKYQKPFTIPDGFPALLKEFAREVLRNQPENIYEFGARYFSELLDERSKEGSGEQYNVAELSGAELEQLVFNLFVNADLDQSGTLDRKEFRNVLSSTELGLSKKQIKKIMSELDEDHDGRLSYNEFLPFMVELLQTVFAKHEVEATRLEEEEEARQEVEEFLLHGMPRQQLEAMMMNIFQRADADGSGKLNRTEFRDCLKAAELGLTRKEINAILTEVDEDHDGQVSYSEFMPLCFNILVERFKDEVLSNEVLRSTDELERELVSTLSQYDEHGAGKLPQRLIKRVLEDLSFQFLGLSTFQILAVMGEADPDSEGMIEITKFAEMAAGMIYTMVDLAGQNLRIAAVGQLSQTEGARYLRGLSLDETRETLQRAFQEADADGNGTLTLAEIVHVLNAMGTDQLHLTQRDINAIMSAIDDDENGVVDYKELSLFVSDLLDHLDREDYIRQYQHQAGQ